MKLDLSIIVRRLLRWLFVIVPGIIPVLYTLFAGNSSSHSGGDVFHIVPLLVTFVALVCVAGIRDVLYSGRIYSWSNLQPVFILILIVFLAYSTLLCGLSSCSNVKLEPVNYGWVLWHSYIIAGLSGLTSLGVEIWLATKESAL